MFDSPILRWLGLAFLLFLLALAMANVVLLTAAVFVLFVVSAGTLLISPARIVIDRRLPRTVCWVGDILEVRRKVEVGAGMGPLFVYDELPGQVRVVRGNNYRVVWKWPGTRSYDLSYALLCAKRGRLVLEGTAWEAQDPLGLHRSARGREAAPLEVSVVPKLRGIDRMSQVRSIASKYGPSADASPIGVSTTDFLDLRPYTPGDTIRSINWKATARSLGSSTTPLVNRYEPEGRKTIWIFLDGASYMDVGTTLVSPIEHAIEAVGTLARYYLPRGYTLGAYVYNSPRNFLPPDTGQRQFSRLTQMLVTLRTGPPSEGLLQAVEWCKGFLFRLQPETFVITRMDVHYPRLGTSSDSFDRFAAGVRRLTSLRAKSRRLGRVHVIHVGVEEYLPMETSLDTQTLDLMKGETRPLFRTLRRSGASVLEWSPMKEEFAAVLLRQLTLSR